MPYQKPQVLAENQNDVPYMMPCMVKEGNRLACKPWFLLKKLCSDNNCLNYYHYALIFILCG